MAKDNILSSKQVCDKLKISYNTLRKLVDCGVLVNRRLHSRGNWRFKEKEVTALMLKD